jgi:hypothetical protein
MNTHCDRLFCTGPRIATCSYYWFERDTDEARCVHDGITNAVTKIKQPELSSVYSAKYKTSVSNTLMSQSR